MNRHLNTFYAYEKPEIENNITRALVLALMSMSPAHLRMFLEELFLKTARNSDPDFFSNYKLLAEPSFKFDLQVSEPDTNERISRDSGFIVGITYSGDEGKMINRAADPQESGRVDGSIVDEANGLTVLLESKINDDLSWDQIDKYRRLFFENEPSQPPPKFVLVSWNLIAQTLHQVLNQSREEREKYIIREFIEYLDILNRLQFMPFTKRDFREQNFEKLHRFLSHIGEKLQGHPCLQLESYSRNYQLRFDGSKPVNLWICFPENHDIGICSLDRDARYLLVSLVCGAGAAWWVDKARNLLFNDEKGKTRLRSIINDLADGLTAIEPSSSLHLNVLARFYLNRFQVQEMGYIRGCFIWPNDFEEFCNTYNSPEVNRIRQSPMKVQEIERIFGKDIERMREYYGQDLDVFPKYGAAPYKEYCFFAISLFWNEKSVVTRTVEDLEKKFRRLLVPFKLASHRLSLLDS